MRQGPLPQGMQPPPEQPVPSSLTLPAGTVIRVRVSGWLSSDRNVIGDGFSAVLDQPIVVDGWVVARRGQSESGRVSQAQKAGRVSGTSKLGLELTDLTAVDGQQLPVQTQMLQSSGGTSHGQDAATIGTTTGLGAAIGAVADGGSGAAIGGWRGSCSRHSRSSNDPRKTHRHFSGIGSYISVAESGNDFNRQKPERISTRYAGRLRFAQPRKSSATLCDARAARIWTSTASVLLWLPVRLRGSLPVLWILSLCPVQFWILWCGYADLAGRSGAILRLPALDIASELVIVRPAAAGLLAKSKYNLK